MKRIYIIEDGGGGVIQNENPEKVNQILNSSNINYPISKKIIFLLFGNFRKDKGHLFITSVWKKKFDSFYDPILWIVGHDEEDLSKEITELNARNIIISNSYVDSDKISTVYQKSDFAILPYLSSYRGGSGPLMKGAFSNGKYALVANVSEMGRIAVEEGLGKAFIAEDADSLTNCVRKVQKLDKESLEKVIMMSNKYSNDRNWEYVGKEFIGSLS